MKKRLYNLLAKSYLMCQGCFYLGVRGCYCTDPKCVGFYVRLIDQLIAKIKPAQPTELKYYHPCSRCGGQMYTYVDPRIFDTPSWSWLVGDIHADSVCSDCIERDTKYWQAQLDRALAEQDYFRDLII